MIVNNKRKNPYDNFNDLENKKRKIDLYNKDNDNSSDKSDKKQDKNSSSDTTSSIYSRENHIYFYSDIKMKTIITLEKEINSTIDKILEKSKIVKNMGFKFDYPPIVLHIGSPGGSIFAAFNFIDYMTQIRRNHSKIKFHSIVEGASASSATLISVTADKRFITEYGYMLIHQLSSVSFGKYNEIKDDIINLDTLMERIKGIYKKHTKVPDEQLDEILKHDIYWDANTCLKYKLVDKIIQ